MQKLEKNNFVLKSSKVSEKIFDRLEQLMPIKLENINTEKTALVVIDIINGFAKSGSLYSSRNEEIIPGIVKLAETFSDKRMPILCLADSHSEDSPEFDSFPTHCLKDSVESEVVDEIKQAAKFIRINKESTNGFLAQEFQDWFLKNPNIDTYIITGDCTDICIMQFALTIKAWFNNQNLKSRIIVPANLVETFDLNEHDGDFMNIVSLYIMLQGGIEIIPEIIL